MKGAESLLNRLHKMEDAVKTGIPAIMEEEIIEAGESAEEGYQTADYEGKNDVTVSVDKLGEKTWTITAEGEAVLFIEFGTGVNLTYNNPWASQSSKYQPASWSAEHSGYLVPPKLQKHHGQWPYHGAWIDGNPSNNVMYNTAKKLKTTLPTEAKKAFR